MFNYALTSVSGRIMFYRLLLFTLLLVNLPLYAAPTNNLALSVGLLYENSDNIFLTPLYKKDDNIIHSIFNVDYQHKSATLVTHLALRADHQNYLKETFPNRTVVSSILSMKSTLSKQRLFWDIDNSFASCAS